MHEKSRLLRACTHGAEGVSVAVCGAELTCKAVRIIQYACQCRITSFDASDSSDL